MYRGDQASRQEREHIRVGTTQAENKGDYRDKQGDKRPQNTFVAVLGAIVVPTGKHEVPEVVCVSVAGLVRGGRCGSRRFARVRCRTGRGCRSYNIFCIISQKVKMTEGTHRTCVVRHIHAIVFVRLAQGKCILVFFLVRKILTCLFVQIIPCIAIVRALQCPIFRITVIKFLNSHDITVNVIIFGVRNFNLQVRGRNICFPKIGSGAVKSMEEVEHITIL